MAPRLSFSIAGAADAADIVALRTAAGERLTRDFGHGHWSSRVTERGVCRDITTSRVVTAYRGKRLVATLSLTTKKPWAIDPAYFHPVKRALYLHNMAVAPDCQRQGIGGRNLRNAVKLAREWPAGAIRLDAYDSPAGAGGFYAACGFREVGRVTYRTVPLVYFEMLL